MNARVAWPGLIEQYRDWLPVTDDAPVVTLGEGATPLIPAPVLSERTGCQVYLKVEGANPTGSFKDRGMTVAVTMAVARGAQAVICASTGNTSASAAAYAARAGLACAVLVPRGKIALGKLAQVAQSFARHEVSIEAVRQEGRGDDAQLVIVTHTAPDAALASCVDDLRAMAVVRAVASVMRVEGDGEA